MATLTIADLDNGKRDLETVDAVANSQADTTTTRYGQQTLTLAGALRHLKAAGEEILSNLGYLVPVPYAPGLEVTTPSFTVVKDGVIYAAQSGKLPFTSGAWDASQWYPIQNDLNDSKLLVFPTRSSAVSAAAVLPDWQPVEVEADETRGGQVTRYRVQSNALVFEYHPLNSGFHTYAAPLSSYAPRTVEAKLAERVSVMDFGAKCDGVTDDSAAVTSAIAAVLSQAGAPKTLFIPGTCLLKSPVILDRVVDGLKNQSYFTIEGGCFLIDYSGAMFTSTLTDPEMPQSSMVQFLNVTFESVTPELYAYVLDGEKFLRMQFLTCSFNKIRLLNANKYVQSIYVQSCNARRYYGNFITCTEGAYDVRIQGSAFEQAGPCASLTSKANKAYVGGCNISNNLIEGIHTGPALTFDAVRGLALHGNYFEANAFEDIKMDTARNLSGECVNMGVVITGSFSQPLESNNALPAFRAIRWGYCFGGKSNSNWSGGRMHAVSVLTKASIGPDFELLPSGDDWTGTYYTGDLPLYSGHYRTVKTTAPRIPDAAGLGELASTEANGAVIIGRGASSDVALLNRTGYTAISVPAGTRSARVHGDLYINSTVLLTQEGAMGNGAGSGAGTLSNAPSAGNPKKWIPLVDAGVVRWIPTW